MSVTIWELRRQGKQAFGNGETGKQEKRIGCEKFLSSKDTIKAKKTTDATKQHFMQKE